MKHSIKITALLISFFFVAQLLGLLIISQYIDYEKSKETGEIQKVGLPYDLQPPEVDKTYSFVYIFVAILIGTAIILLLIKYSWILMWKLWYLFASFFALLIAFGAFLNQTYAFIGAVVFAVLKTFQPTVILHNFTEIFIYGGLAAFFVWVINVKSAILLLVLISIYDMYAVWKSKHMVKMAQFQTESNMFAGLLVPYKLSKLGKLSMKKDLKSKNNGKIVKVRNAILGGGDIAFPLIFAGTVFEQAVLSYPLWEAFARVLIVPICATVALSLLFYKSQENKFYPAMPFITAGCFVGYLLFLLI